MDTIEYSIVVPVYCADNSLEKLHAALLSFFSGKYSFEIIYVDDYSTDNSWEILKKIKSAGTSPVRIIRLSKNFGQHAATMCGFKYSSGEKVITIDDDLAVHPEEISKLIAASKKEDADLIYGVYPQKGKSLLRILLTKYYKLISKIEGKQKGKGSSFRMIKQSLVRKIVNNHAHFIFIDELCIWYTQKIAFLEVNANPDPVIKKRYKMGELFRMSSTVIMFSSMYPLKLMTNAGLLLAFINFVIGGIFLFKKIFLKIHVAGFTSLIVSILFSTGLILLGLGIITQYLLQAMKSINNSPAYNEDEVIC